MGLVFIPRTNTVNPVLDCSCRTKMQLMLLYVTIISLSKNNKYKKD